MLEIKIGCYTNHPSSSLGLQSITMDLATGAFSNLHTDLEIKNPSFILNKDKGVYCVSEVSAEVNDHENPKLVFLENTAHGQGAGLSEIQISGGHPCHIAISPDGCMVATSQYTAGNIDIFALNNDGSIKKRLKTIEMSGQSVHPERQTTSHAHQTQFLRASCELVAIDLGSDKVRFYHYDDQYCFSGLPALEISLPPGSGPRHMVFNKSETVAYILCELSDNIIVIEKKTGVWNVVQEVCVLANESGGLPAAIKLSPDERFLYITCRAQARISCFELHENSGNIHFLFSVSSEGEFPRDFLITPCGSWLIAANQYSNNMVSFRRDPVTGNLFYTGHQCRVGAPTCIGVRE